MITHDSRTTHTVKFNNHISYKVFIMDPRIQIFRDSPDAQKLFQDPKSIYKSTQQKLWRSIWSRLDMKNWTCPTAHVSLALIIILVSVWMPVWWVKLDARFHGVGSIWTAPACLSVTMKLWWKLIMNCAGKRWRLGLGRRSSVSSPSACCHALLWNTRWSD